MRSLATILTLLALAPSPALAYWWDEDADGDGWISMAYGGPDCNDANSSIGPGAYEWCDGVDNNCDGVVDESEDAPLTWYEDQDGDGFGSEPQSKWGCEVPAGGTTAGGDCDDADADVSPAAEDLCGDGIDQDCNGQDAGDAYAFDHDADGFGGWDGWYYCAAPGGTVDDWSDCDDTRAAVSPIAAEVCGNGLDDNCDGWAYEGEWYVADVDGDTWAGWTQLCEPPADPGEWGEAYDCAEGDAAVNPSAEEICGNGVDENCDGWGYEGEWYLADADRDGWGDWGAWTQTCDPDPGLVDPGWGGDCDDGDPELHPGAVDVCADGIDQDCDGTSYEGDAYAFDDDRDGHGAWHGELWCEPPADAVDTWGDCNDADPSINPDEPENCQDGVDQNCDGHDWAASGWYALDQDHDGFGSSEWAWFETCETAGYADNADDCDDTDPRAPLLHDCPDPYGGNLYAVASRAKWVEANWSSDWSDCTVRWAYLTAYDATTHTVYRPQDSGAPGAPSKSLDVYAMDFDINYCDWDGGWGWLTGSDIRITGQGARTRLTGTATAEGTKFGTGTVAIDLLWTLDGAEAQRTGSEYVVTDEGYRFRYTYSGVARTGTVSGNIGELQLSGVWGSASTDRSGTFQIWSE